MTIADDLRTGLRPQRLTLLFVVALCDIAIWSLTAIFATSEFYRRSVLMGGIANWHDVLAVQLVTALLWAFTTPFVVAMAGRLPVTGPRRVRNILIVVALLPILGALRAGGGGAALNLGEGDPVSRHMVLLSLRIRTHRDIAIFAAIFLVCYLVEAQRTAASRERKRIAAQTMVARAEIEELCRDLQPQFALKLIRHVGDVLRAEPRVAEDLIVSLSSILRQSMGRATEERVRLGDELEHVDACLRLYSAGQRFPLSVRFEADEEVMSCRVPAQVLHPIVESIVLDLIEDGGGGAVHLRCTIHDDEVSVSATISGTGERSRFAYEQAAAAVAGRLGVDTNDLWHVRVKHSDGAIEMNVRIPYERAMEDDWPAREEVGA